MDVLFIFAHQDDEVGAAPWIVDELELGNRVFCVYLTDGGSRTDPAIRDAESVAALQSLGVSEGNIAFLGNGERIGDNKLIDHLPRAWRLLDGWITDNVPLVARIYSLAWEGGHPDHDAAHALALIAAERRGISDAWQFSLYNAYRRPRPFFRVLSHVPTEADERRRSDKLAAKMKYAMYCWRFKSQRRTWLGLFPELAIRRLLGISEKVVRFDRQRIAERPHVGELLYERMFMTDYKRFDGQMEAMRSELAPSRNSLP